MRNALIAVLLLCAASARAQTPQGLPSFGYTGFSELRAAAKTAVPPQAQAGDVIAKNNLLVQAGKGFLFGYADDETAYREAAAYWGAALKAGGVQTGEASFSDGMFKIPYASADGRALQVFLADPKQFPPKDEAGLRANMALAQAALARAGLPVAVARVVNVDVILPTYCLLYWTAPDENPDHETRLRVLKPGEDIDFDVFRSAGLDVVQTPETWMMVYIGPEAGYVTLFAKTAEDLQKKIQDRRDFLVQNGKRIITTKTFPIDDPEYKFGAGIYFFQ